MPSGSGSNSSAQKKKKPKRTAKEEQVYRYFFVRSESPPEDFGDAKGAGADGLWPARVVSEEVDARGDIRHEVEWLTWKRADGTNTTWGKEHVRSGDMIAEWDMRQAARREKIARDSRGVVNVQRTMCGYDLHNDATRLRAEGYEEKVGLVERTKRAERERRKAREGRGLTQDTQLTQSTSAPGPSSSPAPLTQGTTSSVSSRPSSSSLRPIAATSATAVSPAASRRTRALAAASSTATLILGSQSERAPSPSQSMAALQSSWRSSVVSVGSTVSSSGTQRIPVPRKPYVQVPPNRWRSQSGSLYLPTQEREREKEKEKGKGRLDNSASGSKRKRSVSPVIQSPRKVKKKVGTPASGSRSREASIPLPIEQTRRQRKLSQKWTEASGIPEYPIKFVNQYDDDEEIPPGMEEFVYSEAAYIYAPDVPKPDPDFFVGCGCTGKCDDSCDEECQVKSDEKRPRPYNDLGLFTGSAGDDEYLECTPACSCDSTCPNRVVQRKRAIPIEIFKTKHKGWGVRSTVEIQEGQILGIYTGLLIHRRNADTADVDYAFDLDGHENFADGQDHFDGYGYTVDSKMHGNWTRFINHSCRPNLTIFNVVFDTLPQTGMPYIAFAAQQRIPARVEFTFDYAPQHEEGLPDGRRLCYCGDSACRTYIN